MAADVVSEVRCGSKVGGSAHSLLNVPPGATSEPTDASAIVLISDFSLGKIRNQDYSGCIGW